LREREHSVSAEAASTPHIVKRAELPGLERLRLRVGGPFVTSGAVSRNSRRRTALLRESHPGDSCEAPCETDHPCGRTGVNELFRVKGRRWRCHFDTIRGRTHALCSPRRASRHADAGARFFVRCSSGEALAKSWSPELPLTNALRRSCGWPDRRSSVAPSHAFAHAVATVGRRRVEGPSRVAAERA
jgi:hypothetical protein